MRIVSSHRGRPPHVVRDAPFAAERRDSLRFPFANSQVPQKGPFMPVRFSCPDCGRTMETPDGTEGRRTACPGCQQVITIPGPTFAPPSNSGAGFPPSNISPGFPPSSGYPSNPSAFAPAPPAPPPAPYPPSNAGMPDILNWSPYALPSGDNITGAPLLRPALSPTNPAAGSAPPLPGAGSGAFNPYAASAGGAFTTPAGAAPAIRDPAYARSRLAAPAMILIALALLDLLAVFVIGLLVVIGVADAGPQAAAELIGEIPWVLGRVVWQFVIIVGAISMFRVRNINLCKGGAVAAVIPFCSSGILLSIPFGAWALYVLNRRDVEVCFPD
jgi:hypothetical protein